MKFPALLASLPSLRLAPVAPMSHGELLAGRFVLAVWNPSTDWVAEARADGLSNAAAAKRFDAIEAAGVWDTAHLAVLRAWLESPEFP